ncbi:hypothetical protein VFMJ11_A0757 [Aliivibrio fischeri MJ11]|uniref:Uncharacterized protein n=1 Tax=Aliivibrio fischeri (strain MJ11) TaxID=388396 RepID=B5EU92_ALIFM|nr:hypothetical protein [Aliivibrio fischeri]ACH64287.1 hypothetical protein VFMJ11_A0711 [Aliivibrio fischeri MJ11]ACH64307.1 hypothetical protein VFMJ11_A0757 [Aliivibrio fischeri MJ11]
MKDIVKSLKDNATSRLKNPVVGAFVLAWTILNINGIALFIMVDTATKITMVNNKEWELVSDFLLPLIISIIYLFVLPLLNLIYEAVNDGVINYSRSSRKNITAKRLAIQKKATVIAEIESDVSFLQKLKDKDIENWLAEKTIRNKEVIELKERYSKLISDSAEANRKSLAEISAVKQQMYLLNEEKNNLSKNEQKKIVYIEESTDQMLRLLTSLETCDLPIEHAQELKSLRDLVNHTRFEYLIWDEDIPF